MSRRRKLIFVVIALLACCVCSPIIVLPFSVCTLAGCENLVQIWVADTLPETYEVEVWFPKDGYVKFQCDKGVLIQEGSVGIDDKDKNFGQDFTQICEAQGVITRYAPKEFTVKITWDGGSVKHTVKPDYEVSRPNGYFCPPTCYYAEIKLEIS